MGSLHDGLSLPREDRATWSAASTHQAARRADAPHIIKSLEQENAWLKEQLARIVRDK
jgi:hypothetical protein